MATHARDVSLAGAVISAGREELVIIPPRSGRGLFEVTLPMTQGDLSARLLVNRQGVTTIIEGPDGGSPVPLAPFLAKLDATQKSINIGTFIGQGSVRESVLGRANRRPTPAELDKMRGLVEDGMKAGAFGMSTGLFYVPGAFTPIEEVIELAKVAG